MPEYVRPRALVPIRLVWKVAMPFAQSQPVLLLKVPLMGQEHWASPLPEPKTCKCPRGPVWGHSQVRPGLLCLVYRAIACLKIL
jgi:hypothetical protein